MINDLKPCPGFKTTDGQFHTSRLQGLLAQQKIDVRGLLQSHPIGAALKNGHVPTCDAVQIIIDDADKFADIVRRYRRSIKHERSKGAGV